MTSRGLEDACDCARARAKGIHEREERMNIEITKLRADIGALARECRALKDILGTTWTRKMADEQRRLIRLRWRVTELHILGAWQRTKLHARNVRNVDDTAAWHAKIAERVAKDYFVAEATIPVEETR